MIKPFNGCFDAACRALRFLANHPRPAGGEDIFNAAHLFQIADEVEKALRDDLTVAPGDDDLTFGSLLDTMIRRCFERAGSRHAGGLYYMRCHHCNGTSIDRPVGERETRIDLVKHDPNCLVAKHMPRMRAMANKGVT